MAKISTSQKNGSVGVSTFVRSRYGLVERQRVVPRDPQTPAQLQQRGYLSGVASQWRGLTEEARAGWRALAGQLPGQLSGCQMFIKVNVTRLSCGLPLVEAAPSPPVFGILVCTGLVADASPAVRLSQVTDTVAPDAFIIEACRPMSAGVQYVEKQFRQILVVPGHAGPGADIELTAAYCARFGAPRAGARVFVRVSAMRNGFRDAPVQLDAIVAPSPGVTLPLSVT